MPSVPSHDRFLLREASCLSWFLINQFSSSRPLPYAPGDLHATLTSHLYCALALVIARPSEFASQLTCAQDVAITPTCLRAQPGGFR